MQGNYSSKIKISNVSQLSRLLTCKTYKPLPSMFLVKFPNCKEQPETAAFLLSLLLSSVNIVSIVSFIKSLQSPTLILAGRRNFKVNIVKLNPIITYLLSRSSVQV